jgi:peroxiredoxin Q/BCP
VEENRKFAEKFDFPFDLLSDEDRELALELGACNAPSDGYAKRMSVLIDPEGRIARIYPKVDPATHPQQVLQDLRELRSS